MSSDSIPSPPSPNDYGTQLAWDFQHPGEAAKQPGGLAGMLTLDPLAIGAQKNFNDMKGPGDPKFAGDAPKRSDATMAALSAQLREELKMRASATLFAGNTPTSPSAGQQLMGR